MIVGSELAGFAADRRRQRESLEAIARSATDWRQGEYHRRFADTLALVDADDADGIAASVQRLFADDAWLDALIAAFAGELRRNPWFDPPFPALTGDLQTGLLVYDDDKVAIAAGVIRIAQIAERKSGKRGATSVNFSGQVSVVKFVKAGGATLSFWEAPPIGWDFTGESAGRCRQVERRRIADGETIVVDGRHQGYVIDHVRSSLLVVQAEVKAGRAPVSVEYDSVSHEFVGCSALDDSDSRIQMITTLVRKLGHAEAVPVLVRFLDHPRFFVRWHVMRELLGIDVAAALPHLRRMAAEDPHPDARAVAGTVLGRAEQALGQRKAA